MERIKLKVPATSANLGAGFDSVGIAFCLYNQIEFEKQKHGFCIEGCPPKDCGEANLAYVAYREVCKRIGKDPWVRITFCETNVPISRGLGSSAALICAGAYAANALWGNVLSKEEILQICVGVEGHPDNVAPALFGGLCVSVTEGQKTHSVRFDVSEKLCFTVLIPSFRVSTKQARAVLPKEVLRTDAVYNLSRAALLPYALETGNVELLKITTGDRLHEQYRKQLFRNAAEVESLCRECGGETFNVSGAGPTFLCISAHRMEEALNEKLQGIANGWKALAVTINKKGIEEVSQ